MTDLDQLREIQRERREHYQQAARLIRLHTARECDDLADSRMAPVFSKVSKTWWQEPDDRYDDEPLVRWFVVIIAILWLVLVCVAVCDG